MAQRPAVGRRTFLAAGALASLAAGAACSSREVKDAKLVRVGTVPTPVDGGLLPIIVAAFEKASSLKVEVQVATDDVYDLARAGKADLVISHWGHKQTEAFVTEGLGSWPRTLFANQLALVGPPSDPAKVRGLTDIVEAFRRIAASGAPFIVNDLDGCRYLLEIVWNAAGRPERDPKWYVDGTATRVEATALAEARGGYTMWGLTPFLREQRAQPRGLEPLVVGDAMLQRLMVSVVVQPSRVAGVNAAGAAALEKFMLEPETQALIRGTHYPGTPIAAWAPAGRHNRSALLPGSRGR